MRFLSPPLIIVLLADSFPASDAYILTIPTAFYKRRHAANKPFEAEKIGNSNANTPFARGALVKMAFSDQDALVQDISISWLEDWLESFFTRLDQITIQW
jgi:hypothetical protein